MKWDFCSKTNSEKKYVVCNADEGDSGAFSDRYLLEEQPLKVLFGMIVCAYIVGSNEGVLYIRGEYPKSIEIINLLSNDYHCHSHTHNTANFDSKIEISQCALIFEKTFGYKALGYRAPQGVLYDGDVNLIKENGFKFSSSIFPSYRPGKYNNLSLPIDPYTGNTFVANISIGTSALYTD